MSRARPAAAKRRGHSLKIRSGDEVKVIAGKDRGKTGRVLRVEPVANRLYVEGLNMVKRHMRPQQVSGTRGEIGGVIEREAAIHVSNVMLLDPKGHPTRVGLEREDGRRYRVAKTTKARID